MDSTIPADLLKLKACLEAWRATRKYPRQLLDDHVDILDHLRGRCDRN
jgi:hypothetical protein